MSDSSNIIKITFILVLVGILAAYMSTSIAGSGQLVGYSEFVGTVEAFNVAVNVHWPEFNNTGASQNCDWWELWCHAQNVFTSVQAAVGYLAGVFLTAIAAIFQFFIWAATLVTQFFVLLFSMATLNFNPPLPTEIRLLLSAIYIPFLVIIVLYIIGWARGIMSV